MTIKKFVINKDNKNIKITIASDNDTDADYNNTGARKHGLSLFTAVVFIAGELAGSGILAYPNGMSNTGWYGMIILLCNGMFACLSGVCLAQCWNILEERYPEYRSPQRNPFPLIGYRANGKWMSYVCSAVMDITFFGAPVVFLLICSEQMESLTQTYLRHVTFCDWILILGVALLPFTLFGSPADVWPVAVAAIGTTVLGLIFLMVNIGLDATTTNETAKTVVHDSPNVKSFFLGFGIITFGFGGAAAFPGIQTDMKDKSQFPKAVVIAFCVVMFLFYIPVSVAGYTVYGTGVSANILNSLSNGWIKTTATVFFTVHLLMAIVMLLNPVAQEFENCLNIPKHFTYKRIITRSVLMAAVMFTALSVPKFGKILDLLGASTITLMALILPPVFYLSLLRQQDDNPIWPKRQIDIKLKIIMLIPIAIGLVAGIASTYFALYELVNPDAFTYPCYLQCHAFYK